VYAAFLILRQQVNLPTVAAVLVGDGRSVSLALLGAF
jgi:hypothetical protein